MILRSYKFRLYPNKEIEKKLEEQLEICRWLYNKLLEEINPSLATTLSTGKASMPWVPLGVDYHYKRLCGTLHATQRNTSRCTQPVGELVGGDKA